METPKEGPRNSDSSNGEVSNQAITPVVFVYLLSTATRYTQTDPVLHMGPDEWEIKPASVRDVSRSQRGPRT